MGALNKASSAYKTFEGKLLAVEKQIEKLQAELEKLQKKEKDLRDALEEHLANLKIG